MAYQNRPPSIVYAAVIDRTGVLVQTGSFVSVMNNVIIPLIEQMDFSINTKKNFKPSSIVHDHTIQYIIEDSIGYISAAHPDFQTRICFSFLEQAKADYKMNSDPVKFAKHLERLIEYYSFDVSGDKIRYIQSEVDECTRIMSNNIKNTFQKGAALEFLEEKTSTLASMSGLWSKASTELKWAEYRRNYICLISLVVFAVVCT
eukprot:TRINITY_DN809_c0_g1_i5.p1 TRINITY_DN809_c0_g1~~TRINITY_DN809_c0_g1_i5.p1  ORF type:complete len:203 (+),score=28.32 TRINITY_DN809_c0_g1_i5:15-623(+)